MNRGLIALFLIVAVGGWFGYQWWNEGKPVPWYVSGGNPVYTDGEWKLGVRTQEIPIVVQTGVCWVGDDSPLAGIETVETSTSVTIEARIRRQVNIGGEDAGCAPDPQETVRLAGPLGDRQLLMDAGDGPVPAPIAPPSGG